LNTLLLAAAAFWLAGAAPGAKQAPDSQQAPLTVAWDSADGRARLRVGSVLDSDELENATRSGLPVRLRIRVELWRDGFFDHLEGSEIWNAVLLYEPIERQYILRPPRGAAERFSDYRSARRALERRYDVAVRPSREGRYYYTAKLEIETLSLSDLEELERWLQGELRPAVTGERSVTGAVSEGAKRLLIRLLGLPARRIEARSERFDVG
jgi:hypothetical protein